MTVAQRYTKPDKKKNVLAFFMIYVINIKMTIIET